jgi:hypothetical protein
MSSYSKNGNIWKPHREGSLNLQPGLDVGNYKVLQDQYGNFFLEKIDDFTVPDEVYGALPSLAERVIRTFESRPRGTGVLLSGEKGSGKTLLAKKVCVDAQIPVIVINQPYTGDNFNSFLQSIDQPCAIFFDEFEKVYNNNQDQEKLLTLFDGVYASKKLFLITSNNSFAVNQHMRNRPGRIYYFIEFSGLEEHFVRDYCERKLSNPEHVERVVSLSKLFSEFNFDMLSSVVEELNRYPDCDVKECISLLNVKPESDQGGLYTARLFVDGVEAELAVGDRRRIGNPLQMSSYNYDYCIKRAPGEDPEEAITESDWKDITIDSSDFVNYDPATVSYTFTKDGKYTVVWTMVPSAGRSRKNFAIY